MIDYENNCNHKGQRSKDTFIATNRKSSGKNGAYRYDNYDKEDGIWWTIIKGIGIFLILLGVVFCLFFMKELFKVIYDRIKGTNLVVEE